MAADQGAESLFSVKVKGKKSSGVKKATKLDKVNKEKEELETELLEARVEAAR